MKSSKNEKTFRAHNYIDKQPLFPGVRRTLKAGSAVLGVTGAIAGVGFVAGKATSDRAPDSPPEHFSPEQITASQYWKDTGEPLPQDARELVFSDKSIRHEVLPPEDTSTTTQP